MSTGYDEDLDDDDTTTDPAPKQDSPAELRAAAKRGKAAASENERLQRENAFLKAGIDPDDQRLGYFVRGYTGELKTDAIKQAAVEGGFIQPDPAQAQQAADQQANLGSQQRVAQASAGAQVESSSEAAVMAQLEQAMAEGGLPAMLDVARQYGLPVTYDGQ